MNPMDIHESLKKLGQGFFEVHHLMTFRCHRRMKEGSAQEVMVEVSDGGPDMEQGRYSCVARSNDGKTALGNPAESIEDALSLVHWHNLG